MANQFDQRVAAELLQYSNLVKFRLLFFAVAGRQVLPFELTEFHMTGATPVLRPCSRLAELRCCNDFDAEAEF